MPYQDRTLTCVDCGTGFVFSAEDQEFHAQKGYTNEPRRCPTCRATRRQSGGGGGYGGFGGGREMTTVTCSRCGREAQVPFVPRGDRPVYCSDCFGRERTAGGPNRRY